jgi:hypothetical protein
MTLLYRQRGRYECPECEKGADFSTGDASPEYKYKIGDLAMCCNCWKRIGHITRIEDESPWDTNLPYPD